MLELVLPVDASGNFLLAPGSSYGPAAPIWSYTAPEFYSHIMSGAQRLPNGNTLICSATQSWIFEVTPAGQSVWEHRGPAENIFYARHTQRSLWANRESLSAAAGGTVGFDLEVGCANAGDLYVMLGSASGVSPGFSLNGIGVPLNVDGYFTSLLPAVGTGAFASWVGVLNSRGGTKASYGLPSLSFLAGLTLHHAMLTIDGSGHTLVHASNAVPLVFLP